jgi:hypothetical protein
MEFKNSDLLTKNSFEILFTTAFPHNKAQILTEKLSKYCFIYADQIYYIQDNLTYIPTNLTSGKGQLISKITLFLQRSYENLPLVDQHKIALDHQKVLVKNFQNSYIDSNYYAQMCMLLQNSLRNPCGIAAGSLWNRYGNDAESLCNRCAIDA